MLAFWALLNFLMGKMKRMPMREKEKVQSFKSRFGPEKAASVLSLVR
jgi:hypothetical protein